MSWLDTFQSAAGNDGQQSALVSELFAIFLAVTALFFVAVMIFLIWAILRRRRGEGESREPALRRLLVGWVGLISLTLAGLTLATWLYDRGLARAAATPALEIEVTANQWWWDVRYADDDANWIFRTANELHLPAGVPAHITLRSNDVIHSFWVPNLAGKQDMIPGREADISIRPLRRGVYRAQCAEFCGLQHARMALDVTVESPADFIAWRAAALKPAAAPVGGSAQAGQAIVTGRQCASCHSIAGTPASGQVAPDLTHFASRRTIAAGTLPMSRANIAAWIADPQAVKPGNNMPKVPLTPAELAAVTAYLETLK
ncbi:MAG TPA: cytochrome c oxidase subunit II [Allosphingosinicella sp.]|jgi:cytochrome c oxidase subunit 2